MSAFLDAIVGVHEHQLRCEACDFFFFHLDKGGNDDQVTHRGTPRRRTIDRNDAAAAFGADRTGDEALAVIAVPDMDLLVFAEAGGIQQVFVNGGGSLVIELAVGHGGAGGFWFFSRVLNMVRKNGRQQQGLRRSPRLSDGLENCTVRFLF